MVGREGLGTTPIFIAYRNSLVENAVVPSYHHLLLHLDHELQDHIRLDRLS